MNKKVEPGVYLLNDKTPVFFASSKRAAHTRVPMKKEGGEDRFSLWGDDNLYPQRFVDKLNRTGAAIGGLEVLISAHYGGGFKLFQEREDEQGHIQEVPRAVCSFPEIQQFFHRVRWPIFLSEMIMDYEIFHIAFPEYLLSPSRDKIISVKRQPAAFCRLGTPNEKTGQITKVLINTDWENYEESSTSAVDCISPEVGLEEMKAYVKKKKLDRFIVPVAGGLVAEKVYPRVRWHSSFRNGWIDVVLSIPTLKKYIFENQLHIKYVVYVADDFFAHRYGIEQWRDFTEEKKEQLRQSLVEKIDAHMSGNQAGGRSFTSPFFRDTNGHMIKGIEVIPIENPLKEGNYLLDASAGNAEILFAMGVDPSLIGAGILGGKNLSGSGSDKREAYTILTTRMPVRRIRTLEPFCLLRDWNGWEASLIGKFPNLNLTTLDKNPSGQTEIIHG